MKKNLLNDFLLKKSFNLKKIIFVLILSSFSLNIQATPREISSYTTGGGGNWNSAGSWAPKTFNGSIVGTLLSPVITGTGTSFTTDLAVGSILWGNDKCLASTCSSHKPRHSSINSK